MIESIITNLVSDSIESWIKLKNTKKQEELNTPEWQQLEKAYMNHLTWRFQYQTKIFRQQIISSWIITVIVLLLVLGGLVFSGIQLYAAVELRDFSSMQTDIVVETAGKLSFQSSLVGAIVLIISLLFFSLYLKHVFQIQYPIPPHISISETDASSLFNKKNDPIVENTKLGA